MASRKQPQQERARDSRERILETAAHLFADHGIAGTSTNRIAAEAGMSIGSLYRYFSDKREIVHVLRQRTLDELEASFTTSVLAGLSLTPAEGIEQNIRAIVQALADRRGLVPALFTEPGPAVGGFGALEARLRVLTRAYLLHVLGPRPDAELDSRAFLMVTVGLATSARLGLSMPEELDRDVLVTETARMLSAWLES
jgi:AcrR family transcriptional regulator